MIKMETVSSGDVVCNGKEQTFVRYRFDRPITILPGQLLEIVENESGTYCAIVSPWCTVVSTNNQKSEGAHASE